MTVSKRSPLERFEDHYWSMHDADRSFATVCALDVLEHVHNPTSLLAEMKRIGRTVCASLLEL